MAETDVFKHATPELYDRYMGPLLFAPYAQHVAQRVADLRPDRILETASGTECVTFRAADAQELPFDDESFDLVRCTPRPSAGRPVPVGDVQQPRSESRSEGGGRGWRVCGLLEANHH